MYIFLSLLEVKKSLGHAQIDLLQEFNSKFPTSIPTPLICGVPPPAGNISPKSSDSISILQTADDSKQQVTCAASLRGQDRVKFLEIYYTSQHRLKLAGSYILKTPRLIRAPRTYFLYQISRAFGSKLARRAFDFNVKN